MAPFRASRSTRSGRPGGQSEQEVIDGLPVRQWRLQESFVDTSDDATAKPSPNAEKSTIWKELPMPKGSEHYSPWCQQLLRLARAGRILQSQAGVNGGKKETGEGERDENADTAAAAKNAKAGMKRGFGAIRWAQVAKTSEEPEREYLAKRRKGLPPLNGGLGLGASAATMRKTKVRRVDAAGNAYVWEVLVPEGQTVEGEIKDEVAPETVAAKLSAPPPGTIVEGLGIANEQGVVIAQDSATAPIKRKGPPPRRKPKRGPGRGHKKIVSFSEGNPASIMSTTGTQQTGGEGAVNGDMATAVGTADEANGHHDGDEEDEEYGEDYEEGEEGEDYENGREEGEITPSPRPQEQETSTLPLETDIDNAMDDSLPHVPEDESKPIQPELLAASGHTPTEGDPTPHTILAQQLSQDDQPTDTLPPPPPAPPLEVFEPPCANAETTEMLAQPVQNSVVSKVEDDVKMADVKPEVSAPEMQSAVDVKIDAATTESVPQTVDMEQPLEKQEPLEQLEPEGKTESTQET